MTATKLMCSRSWQGRVAGLEQHGDTVRVEVDGVPPVLADVTTAAVAELDLLPGAPVWPSVKATELHLDAAQAPPQEAPQGAPVPALPARAQLPRRWAGDPVRLP